VPERAPFDPSRLHRPPQPATEAGQPGLLTPRQVNELVRGALHQHLPATLHVLGEIGDLSRPSSGHVYFTLKDPHSELPCVMWRSTAARIKFQLELGMQVIATGNVDVYTPRGAYQLYVSRLEPRGVGALELAFRQLKERLAREGLLDAQRKKPLPPVPQRLAIVTSPTGAAIRDILQTLRRRFPILDILLFPVRVQGEGAAQDIAAAIRLMNDFAVELGGIDVAIIGRGGGSLEDLWAFNEEVVARAIAASRIPIVSAVGHEVDVTISDLVADLRAPTPTAAAELIAPRLSDLIEWLGQRATRASHSMSHALDLATARLKAVLAYDGLARPLARIQQRAQAVDELTGRLRLVTSERFRATRARLNRAEFVVLRFGTGAYFRRLSRELAERVVRLQRALGQPVVRGQRGLADRLAHLGAVAPDRQLARSDEHCRQVLQRLGLAARGGITRGREHLQSRLDALTAYDPQRVLLRGYSITRDARTRRIIRSVAEIREGLRLATQLPDGEFRSTAEDPRQARLFD
jgi:exodeoxyribonuclease VII large subunit